MGTYLVFVEAQNNFREHIKLITTLHARNGQQVNRTEIKIYDKNQYESVDSR